MRKMMILFLALGMLSCGPGRSVGSVEVVPPIDFRKELQNEGVQLIDVRTPEEFEAGHLMGAVNMDFLSEDFLKEVSRLDKKKPVLLYCRSGNRSAKATGQLLKHGFQEITDLKGGYRAWEEFKKEKE